jgi:hypothetical protein
MERAAEEFARQPAPHRPPREVRAALLSRLLALITPQSAPAPAEGGEDLQAPLGPRSEWPGRQPWQMSGKERSEAGRLAFVVRQMPHVEDLLFDKPGGCGYCHGQPTRGPDGLPEFAKPDVPNRWLPHARFGHESHRMLKCEECHEGARQSSQTSDVLIPDMQKCAECHNHRVGARSDCVECHGYHQYGPGGHKAQKDLTIPQALGK